MKGRPRREAREPTQAQRLFRRLVREWLWVSLILLPLTAILSLSQSLTLSNLLYDNLRRLSPLPVDPRILIVTIDDYSLQQLGQWPWSRVLHADLLDRLSAAKAKGILFDVIFSEPDSHPDNHQRLAQAACRAGNVFVPLLREGVARYGQPLGEIEPVAPLSHCAMGIGHINAEADVDGIVRSVYLSEGSAQNPRAQLAWLLYQLSQPGDHPPSMPGTPAPLSVQGWQRSHEIRIPFIRADAGFPSVPYVSVLRGEVAPQLLRDRLILIGSTAPGLGDRYVTPQSASLGTTPGIEIQANILNGLLQQRSIVVLDERLSVLLSVMLVGLLLGLLLLRPRLALWMTVGGIAVALLGSCLLLRLGWWWSPAASLSGFLLAYLIWNWRRLSAVLAYFGWELARLNDEPKVLPERRQPVVSKGDVLQGRIAALEQALGRTRDTRRFMADGLECLPVATLITDTRGQVLLANRSARELLGPALVGEDWLECLAGLGFPGMDGPARPALTELLSQEFRDSHQRTLHLDLAPLRST